jgi:hypothetical protein
MPASAMFQKRSAAVGGIACHALRTARLSEIDALRDGPGPAGAPALPSRFLRHADEQTVLGMHALLAALAAAPEPRPMVEHCGIVSATCQAGRIAAARTLIQFHDQGVVGVSPHVVPQCSLHSLAGAVSVALGMHGPHLGVGGGPDALAEGLVAALSLLTLGAGESLPGVWLVATEWEEEPALDARGAATNDPLCRALAVLLMASGEGDLEIDLRGPGAARPRPREAAGRTGRLTEFARAVTMCRQGTALESWALDCPWPGVIRVARRWTRTVWPDVRGAA